MRRKGLGKGLGKGYRNLTVLDPTIHSRSARGIKTYSNLIKLPKSKDVIYHSGVFQNVFDENHPHKLKKDEVKNKLKAIDSIKRQINYLLYDANFYMGEEATDPEVLTVVVLKDKAHHFDFLTSHTDWKSVGNWKNDITGETYDKENNLVLQIQFLDTKNEYIGNELIRLFKELNDYEVGEQVLYVRTSPVEESTLPLKEWRNKK